MRPDVKATILLGVFCASVFAAKTPQQLKSDLAGILPANKKCRIAYCRGSWDLGRASSIYVVDSDDGVTRELTPSSIFTGAGTRHLEHPSVTADGSRVVFWDASSQTVYVINWDGTGLKAVYECSYFSRYWRNPADGSDWFTCEDGGISRINIDNPSQKVLLWNKTDVGRPWYTLSADGTRMVLNCPHPTVGIAVVPNGTLTKMPFEGCFVNIAPDNTYRVMPQNGAGSGYTDHTVYVILKANGTQDQVVRVSDPIIAELQKIGKWGGGEKEYEDNRWVEPDYTTFFLYQAKVNPFLFCLSTGKFVWFNDGGTYSQDGFDMDMRLLNAGASSTVSGHARAAELPAGARDMAAFALDGRRASVVPGRSAGGAARGVVVTPGKRGVPSGRFVD